MFGEISSSSQRFCKCSDEFRFEECKLAPKNRVMLRKLKFAKLDNKFCAFYGTKHEGVLLCSQEPATCKFIDPKIQRISVGKVTDCSKTVISFTYIHPEDLYNYR